MATKLKVGFGTVKNLAVVGALALAGFFIYRKSQSWFSTGDSASASGSDSSGQDKDQTKKSSGPSGPPPDLGGPAVRKGMLASTRSKICISEKAPRMLYAPIIKVDQQGYAAFRAPANGHFTRRLLCTGSGKFAEVYPS